MSFADHGSNNPTAVSATLGRRFAGSPGGRATRLASNLLMPLILAGMATYFVVGIARMEVPEGTIFPGPGFFPGLIAAGLYLFAALLAVQAFRPEPAPTSGTDAPAETDGASEAGDGAGRVRWASLAWVVLGFAGFALTLGFLGWIIGAALLFWCVARGFGEKRHVLSLIVGLTASSISYIAFDMALGLNLPSGILGGVL